MVIAPPYCMRSPGGQRPLQCLARGKAFVGVAGIRLLPADLYRLGAATANLALTQWIDRGSLSANLGRCDAQPALELILPGLAGQVEIPGLDSGRNRCAGHCGVSGSRDRQH